MTRILLLLSALTLLLLPPAHAQHADPTPYLSDEEIEQADLYYSDLHLYVHTEPAPCPPGLNCVPVPTVVLGAPVYDVRGKRCKWYPPSFETDCQVTLTGTCPRGVQPNEWSCRNVRVQKATCSQCGEDVPGFVEPGDIDRPSDYVPTRQELQDDIDLARIYIANNYMNEAWKLAQFAAEKTALMHGFLADKSTRVIVLRKMPEQIVGTIDPHKDIIYLGGGAFGSPERLASIIGHEFRHIYNRRLRKTWPYSGLTYQELYFYDEFDAYSWEIDWAWRTGIPQIVVDDAARNRDQFLREFLNTAQNKAKPARWLQFLPWDSIGGWCMVPWGCNVPAPPRPVKMCSFPTITGGKPIIGPCPVQ